MSQQKHILIVEDDYDMCEILRQVLEFDGYRVDVCHNGLEALDLVKVNDYSVVVSDMVMPKLGGADLYAQCEVSKPWLLDKFIFITGQARMYGSDDFLVNSGAKFFEKPFRIEELLSYIRQLLSNDP